MNATASVLILVCSFLLACVVVEFIDLSGHCLAADITEKYLKNGGEI